MYLSLDKTPVFFIKKQEKNLDFTLPRKHLNWFDLVSLMMMSEMRLF